MTHDDCWQLTWQTGPDAGARWYRDAGRVVVGRAVHAEIRCDDPALEPFHVQLDLDGDVAMVDQLAGRLPVRVHDTNGERQIQLGHSLLVARRCRAPAADNGRSDTVVRVPRHLPTWAPDSVHPRPDPATPSAPSGSLAPALGGLATTVVLALVVRQTMFVVFAAVGTAVALCTWVAGRLAHRRAERGHRSAVAAEGSRVSAQLDVQRGAWVHHVRATVPHLADALATIDASSPAAGVWQRRPADGDAWRVSLGVGGVAWTAVIAGDGPVGTSRWAGGGDVLDDLPVAFELASGARLAVTGPHAHALANAVVLQLATLTGPADWQLVVHTASPDTWRWARRLPHARSDAIGHLVVDEMSLLELVRDGALAGRHTVVVTDQEAMLAVRTSALRRLESTHDSLAVVVVHHGPTPALCRSSVVTMTDARARFVADVVLGSAPVLLRAAGAAGASAERWAQQLRDRRDPEDERLHGLDIPATVDMASLLAEAGTDVTDAASITAAWDRAGHDPSPRAPIGRARDGVVELDLVHDGPHALLAGTTGAGKSELMRTLVVGLACLLSPEHLTFVLIDYKGGAAFDELARLPHVVGTVTDLDHQLAARALRSLRAELSSRERTLREHGVSDLTVLRQRVGAPVMPRVLVVVDEFAALATEQAGFLHALVGIAQRGRSLGIHLLLATQRPSGVISDDIRANTNLRIALRLHDASDALDVVGDASPAAISRALPGRAVMRLGPGELLAFQAAHTHEVAAIVEVIRAAGDAARIGTAPPEPRQVWADPLPEQLDHADVAPLGGSCAGAVGMLDLPDLQTRAGWSWTPGDGSVVVAGSVGSGVTSTLILLAGAALDEAAEVFVIDAGDDTRWDAVARHPRCAGVVRLHERERLWRMLHRISCDVPSPGPARSSRRLVIDGIGGLRLDLDPIERVDQLDLLDRITTASDTVLLIGADRIAAVPAAVVARCAVRVVLHLHDAHEAAALGVAPADVAPCVAGRGFVAGAGAIQFVAPTPLRCADGRRRRVPPIATLPAVVDVGDLPRMPVPPAHSGWSVQIGIGFSTLLPAALDAADGEHVLIAGGARTGRSTALALLVWSWLESQPGAAVVVIGGRRSPLPGWLAGHARVATHRPDQLEAALDDVDAAVAGDRRVMLAVDDAELVEDVSGRLGALVARRTIDPLVVAAGRPDALRQSYGHWTAAVRRSRLGLLAAGSQELEADLLGATLPRRSLLAPRPGLFHLVDGGSVELVQVARPAWGTAVRAEDSDPAP